MKRNLWLVLVLVSGANAYGEVLLDCGRTLNFNHEYSLHMKQDFSTRKADWSMLNYGKRIDNAAWTAKTTEKENIVGAYTLTHRANGVTTDYLFHDFTGCYHDDDSPAAVQIMRDLGDGAGKRLVKKVSCHCQIF